MRLHQLKVDYDAEQDRLLMLVATSEGMELRLSLTRRFVKLLWPLLVGFARVAVAIGGGWIVLKLSGSLAVMFVVVGAALFVYGAGIATAIRLGAWFGRASASRG